VSCEHAFLALLDALEIQRSLLRDGRSDADVGPHRAAFESLERAALTEANRLTGDATVPAVVRARVRAFVSATSRTTTRSTMRTATTPIPPAALMPRAPTPAILPAPALPRTNSGPRAPAGGPPTPSPGSFPGLAVAGVAATMTLPTTTTLSGGTARVPMNNEQARQRVKDFLVALADEWTCPHCGVDVVRTLHLSRVQSGRAGVVIDVVCAGCARHSPMPPSQGPVFDGLFGPLIGINGAGFRPEAYGFLWDNT
jgi:hypothetical protein